MHRPPRQQQHQSRFFFYFHTFFEYSIFCVFFFFFHFSFHLYNISFVLANVLIHFLAKEKRRSRHLVVAFFTNKTKHSVVLLPIFFHPLFVVLAVCVVVDHTITDKHVNPALTVIELNFLFFFVAVVIVVFVYFSEFLNQKKKFFVFGRWLVSCFRMCFCDVHVASVRRHCHQEHASLTNDGGV